MNMQFDEMSDHDDGLVHAHGWASSTPAGALLSSPPQPEDDSHDRGLV